MRLYKISVVSDDTNIKPMWVGTQADAAAARKVFMELGAKRSQLATEEIEVPTAKAGLIDFLNGLEAQ